MFFINQSACSSRRLSLSAQEASVRETATETMSLSNKVVALLVIVFSTIFIVAKADQGSGYLVVCIRNRAMCRKMFGPFFEGQMCTEFYVKYKGKIILDCEDEDSIRPFIASIKDD